MLSILFLLIKKFKFEIFAHSNTLKIVKMHLGLNPENFLQEESELGDLKPALECKSRL